MVMTDYLFEMLSGSGASRLYNPETYDGQNIGCFVNQGGLDDGMKIMACACDRAVPDFVPVLCSMHSRPTASSAIRNMLGESAYL